MDYGALIDDETWAFIRKTGDFYPEDAASQSVADQRQVYDRMCRVFREPYPEGVAAVDRMADGVPVRIYSAGQPSRSVVYLHGGGSVVGGLESHDDICADICSETGYRVISVDYRLAPEHQHPAAFDDAWTVVQWVGREYGDGLVLAGDSAGGNLAAAVAHHARGRPLSILGQVLIYPDLGGDTDKGSYLEHANAPMLTRADVLSYRQIRHSAEMPKGDPTCAPLEDRDYSGLPPTVIFTADCDPLRDEGRDYRDRLVAAGGAAHWVNEQGLVHGYLRARITVERVRASFERISVAVEALGQGIWPYD